MPPAGSAEARATAEKIQSYEKFVDEQLSKDLLKLLKQRDQVYEEIAEYNRLDTTLKTVKIASAADGTMKTQVDLGNNFFCQAKVPDTSLVCVAIGFGFFVEMTLEEAAAFIKKKTEQLGVSGKELTEKVAVVKANIRMVLEGLRELQQLDTYDGDGGGGGAGGGTFFDPRGR